MREGGSFGAVPIFICRRDHINISLYTLDTSIHFSYICEDISHLFKTLVTVQKIKIKHSCSYLAVFCFDIK